MYYPCFKELVAVKDRKTGKQGLVVQDTTKTSKSIRTIPLTNRALVLLKELKTKQQSKINIVFCTKNYTYYYPKTSETHFKAS